MKKKWIYWINKNKTNSDFKIFISAVESSLIGLVFALFNGILWVRYRLAWIGAICIYYLMLSAVRTCLIQYDQKMKKHHQQNPSKRVLFLLHGLVFLMNLSMIAPISIMAHEEREVQFGLIPAIAAAAYTTYRISFAIVRYHRARKVQNRPTNKMLSVIYLMDALMSVLTLQNTLIVVNGTHNDSSMKILSIVSSACIWGIIVLLSVFSLKNTFQDIRNE